MRFVKQIKHFFFTKTAADLRKQKIAKEINAKEVSIAASLFSIQ